MAFGPAPFSLGSGGEPQRVRGHLVSGSYFATLGAVPAAGRLLQASDDRPGAEPAAVLGYRLWRERFGGAPDVLRQSVIVNGRQFTVVGVAAEGFTGPERGQPADLWVPIAALPAINTTQAGWLDQRGTVWLRVIGRLESGRTMGAGRIGRGHDRRRRWRAPIRRPTNSGRPWSRAPPTVSRPASAASSCRSTALLLTVTGLVLLIACANVANLMLARGAGRALEMSIRAAVGASRGRLVRQLLTESLVIAGAGAAAGLLLSFWTSDLLLAQLGESEFRGLDAGADGRVLGFTALLAAGSVCVFGLVPALTATRSALLPRLRETSSAGGGRSRLQRRLRRRAVVVVARAPARGRAQPARAAESGRDRPRLQRAPGDHGVLRSRAPELSDRTPRPLPPRSARAPRGKARRGVRDARQPSAAERHDVQHRRDVHRRSRGAGRRAGVSERRRPAVLQHARDAAPARPRDRRCRTDAARPARR